MQRSNSTFVIDNNTLVKGKPMRKAAVVFSAAAVTVMTAVSIPTPVEARGGWGWGPGIAGGLIAGALIGGPTSNANGNHPRTGYHRPRYRTFRASATRTPRALP